jgi:hypothetical protein
MPRSGFRVDRKPPEMLGRLPIRFWGDSLGTSPSAKSATAPCGGPARGGCLVGSGSAPDRAATRRGARELPVPTLELVKQRHWITSCRKRPVPSRRVMRADVALTHRQVPSAAASCGAHRPMDLRGRKVHRSSSAVRTASGRIRQTPRNERALDGLTVDRIRPMGKQRSMHSWPKGQFQDS